MSTTPSPRPVGPAPTPAVPYGPGIGTPIEVSTGARTAGRTAVKWGIRILLAVLLRAIVRALNRR